MCKRLVGWMAAFVLIPLATMAAHECRADGITVRFDQEVYVVNGPGDSFVAQILIDGDSSAEGIQTVASGLFSAGVMMSFNDLKANVGGGANVVIPAELDYFGFSASSLVSVTPPGEVAFHGNVDQSNAPPTAYNGSPLAEVTITNLASAVDSYPLSLDFSRDLGVDEDFFVAGNGITLDPMITFVPSRVFVAEPSTAMLTFISLVSLFGWRRLRRRSESS